MSSVVAVPSLGLAKNKKRHLDEDANKKARCTAEYVDSTWVMLVALIGADGNRAAALRGLDYESNPKLSDIHTIQCAAMGFAEKMYAKIKDEARAWGEQQQQA